MRRLATWFLVLFGTGRKWPLQDVRVCGGADLSETSYFLQTTKLEREGSERRMRTLHNTNQNYQLFSYSHLKSNNVNGKNLLTWRFPCVRLGHVMLSNLC